MTPEIEKSRVRVPQVLGKAHERYTRVRNKYSRTTPVKETSSDHNETNDMCPLRLAEPYTGIKRWN
jgi:hypothetical protein